MELLRADAIGLELLGEIEAPSDEVAELQARLNALRPDPTAVEDAAAWLVCILALQAVSRGNFGVGAAVVDDSNHIYVFGHNEMMQPLYRSDRHAEMVVINRWEESRIIDPYATLYTSVEPCPMCLIRSSSSTINRVRYVTPDVPGGMATHISDLPPFWAGLASETSFEQANCSTELISVAAATFDANLEPLREKIRGAE